MIRNTLLLLVIFALYSCTRDDDTDLNNNKLSGKWQLIEHYLDPGDGSGNFEAITSEKTVEFFKDGKVVSNGSLCSMSSDTGSKSIGVYDENTKTISSALCSFSDYKISYKLMEGSLQLWYPCKEGCAQKYKKIASN